MKIEVQNMMCEKILGYKKKQFFHRNKNFLAQIFLDWNKIFDQQIFFNPKIFSDPRFFSAQKKLLTKKFSIALV